MRKISVFNQKGGVGKTTVAVNLAAGLARSNKKVLLIDMDPQGNLETCFPVGKEKKTVYELLFEKIQLEDAIQPIATNLDIISSSPMLRKGEQTMASKVGSEYTLSQKLESLEDDAYDFVIIDCSPSFGLLSQNALVASEEIFVPVSTDVLGVDAMHKLVVNIDEFNERLGHTVKISKVIPTMFDTRATVRRDALNEIQNAFYEKLTKPIHNCTKLIEAAKKKQSIFAYAPSSKGAADFKELVKNVLSNTDDYVADSVLATDIGEVKKKAKKVSKPIKKK